MTKRMEISDFDGGGVVVRFAYVNTGGLPDLEISFDYGSGCYTQILSPPDLGEFADHVAKAQKAMLRIYNENR